MEFRKLGIKFGNWKLEELIKDGINIYIYIYIYIYNKLNNFENNWSLGSQSFEN